MGFHKNNADGSVGADAVELPSISGSIHIAPNSLVAGNYDQNSIDQAALCAQVVGAPELKTNAVVTHTVSSGAIGNSKLSYTISSEAVDTLTPIQLLNYREKSALAYA